MPEAGHDSALAELVELAERARELAYARYSNFKVGAAVRSESGRTFSGCNVENASYGATLCAERSAVAAMVAAGERRIVAVAVFTEAEPPSMPCGICRQVLLEFGSAATQIVAVSRSGRRVATLAELLPQPFLLDR